MKSVGHCTRSSTKAARISRARTRPPRAMRSREKRFAARALVMSRWLRETRPPSCDGWWSVWGAEGLKMVDERKTPTSLAHYTNLDGLIGIVKTRELWA